MSEQDDIARTKDGARQQARCARRSIAPEARAHAAELLAARLLTLPGLADARIVLAYGATAEELDVGPAVAALRARGAAIAFPRIEAPGVLGLHLVDSDDELVAGQLGIREPSPDAERISPAELDAVLVPGVAFTLSGARVGYGGGYYDRLLPQLRPECIRIGIAFDQQVLDEVPVLDHDERVHWVVAPTRAARAADYLP